MSIIDIAEALEWKHWNALQFIRKYEGYELRARILARMVIRYKDWI